MTAMLSKFEIEAKIKALKSETEFLQNEVTRLSASELAVKLVLNGKRQ